ncbi:Fatty acyl-CoA reductase 2, partial [Ananas comosus]
LDVPVEEDQVVFSPEKATHKDVETMNSTSCKEAEARTVTLRSGEEGIGIVRFLGGKNFLITGATGFLAKVLIEKILRTNPSVGTIYVLIKAKDKEAAMKRLKTEIVNTELFRCLQEIHGKNYQSFMLRKLIPVVGDVRVGNIGIKPEIAEEISEEVDVIINSAANTTFDERYDVALDINTIGPCRLMSFAKRFKRLKLFLQVSTAYVNGQRQGRILEKPFRIGDTITKETNLSKSAAKHTPMLDIEAEIKLAFDSRRNSSDASAVQEMKDLGLKRAKIYGWQDTYVFTKAMGEMVINCMRGDIPVITMRPSVIESTWKEPFPGWMEGNRMMDPIVLYYGKGQLTGFLADPDGVLDVVPADMVVNATLAAMAKHGSCGEPGMHVYHVASSIVNPLVFQDLARILFEHFSTNPCVDMRGRPILVPPMKLFSDMSKFSTYVSVDAVQKSSRAAEAAGPSTQEKLLQRLKNICTKSVEQAIYLANIYEPYTFYGGRFDNTNTENLMDEMSEDEKRSFPFDVRSIDWKEYISKVHIPGLRKHVMKGRGMCSRPQLVNSSM